MSIKQTSTIQKKETSKAFIEKEVAELLKKLSTHQSELETQNEELRTMQQKLEEARDQYTNLFEFAPVGYFIFDLKGTILNVNLTGSGMLNSERVRVKGKSFTAFLANNNDNYVFFKHLREVFKTEVLHSCQVELKRKGYMPFPAYLDTIAEVDENTGETQFRSTVRDLSGEKKTEKLQVLNEELRLEKEKAQQYLQFSGVFFMTLDKDGIITMINKTGCDILRYTCNTKNCKLKLHENETCQIEGLNWFDNFIPKEDLNEAKQEFKQLLSGKYRNGIRSTNYIITQNRDKRLISWNSVVIKDKEGNICNILKSGEDVTEQKRSEKALKESEKMFRTLFETATESIIIINYKGVIVKVNPITLKLFGYKQDQLIGQQIEILVPKRLKSKHPGYRKEYLKNPKPISMGDDEDIFALKKDESEFPVNISLSSIRVENEPLVMALVTDITERKQAKEKLETLNLELEQKVIKRTRALWESQQMYKLIARNFPNGVINVFDKNLNYVFVDGMEMFNKGITGEMLIGTSFLKRVNPLIRKELKENLMNVFKGHNMTFESKIEDKIYMINAVGLHDVDNNISQILMVTQNITDLKKAENQIKKSLEKERQLNELKTRFVSIASHEFRTPLTTIMNSASLLSKYIESGEAPDKQQNHINRVKKSVHNLTNILNDFLSLDKLDGGHVELQLSELNLPEFFQEIINSLEVITKKGQQIIFAYSGEENVVADKQALTNIYNNLLSNAIKYSGENSNIEFKVNVEDEILATSIKDEGIGILKEDQDKVFERFFRTKDALETQGTGLGLNIVKKYVEVSNGMIDFESRYRRGTTFKVRLPIKIGASVELEE